MKNRMLLLFVVLLISSGIYPISAMAISMHNEYEFTVNELAPEFFQNYVANNPSLEGWSYGLNPGDTFTGFIDYDNDQVQFNDVYPAGQYDIDGNVSINGNTAFYLGSIGNTTAHFYDGSYDRALMFDVLDPGSFTMYWTYAGPLVPMYNGTVSATPEPATCILLGLGLLLMILLRNKLAIKHRQTSSLVVGC
jgi:hypothetical protein